MDAPAENAAAPAKPPEPVLRTFVATRRGFAALAMLAIFEILPAIGLWLSLRDGSGLWTALALGFMAVCALPALGVWRGHRWAFILASYVCWVNLVGTVLRALSTGDIVLHLPFAIFTGLIIAGLDSARPAPPGTVPQERRPDSLGQWVRENLEAIVIAFIMALVIRCFCIEVFKIPSSSMEPTLLGDNNSRHAGCSYKHYHLERYPGGDRIMVTKFFYSLSDIQRYDVLVFKFPLNQPRNFIKRVVGLPNEDLLIHRGNLFVSRPGEGKFAIARRTLRTQDSIWIDLGRGDDFLRDIDAFQECWEAVALPGAKGVAERRLQDRELVTHEKEGVRGVRFKYSKPITDGDYKDVGDLRIAFEFELTSPKGQVFAEIANEFGRFELVLSTEGGSELRRTLGKEVQPTDRAPIEDFRLEMDRRYRLDLSVFDGMAYARIDGGKPTPLKFIETLEQAKSPPGGEVGVSFGSRDATLRARKLSLSRDLYYKGKDRDEGIREDEVIPIKPGHYVMMGDNVDNSHDSRSWKLRTFLLTDGRRVECESQEIDKFDEVKPEEVMRRYGVDRPQDKFIAGDRTGTPWLLYYKDPGGLPPGIPVGIIDKEDPPPQRFWQVDERYIVGKGLWIWWPPGRWFHLIR